jgi:hypothetical protein
MGLTNFPHGITSFGIPVLGSGSLIPSTTGSVFFVSSGTGSNGNDGKSPDSAFATVDYAVGKCTADKGDVIIVMPGHAEALTSSSLTLDVAGISVIGLGAGRLRPTLTAAATTGTVTVSADDITLRNFVFVANVDNAVTAITVGAAKDFTIEGCEFVDNSNALHWLSAITVGTSDNAADGLKVINNRWWGLAVAPAAFLSITGDLDRLYVADNYADMAVTDDEGHFITLTSDTVRAAQIVNNTLYCVGSTGAATGVFLTGSATDCSGEVSYNRVRSLDTTTELIATAGTGLAFFENYYTGTADASGKLWPAVDGA